MCLITATADSSSIVGHTFRPISSNQLLGQNFRPIFSNQLLANHSFIDSTTFRERGKTGEDGVEAQVPLSVPPQPPTTTTTPPTLTDEKVGVGNNGGRTSENSVTLTLICIWKTQTERLTINIMGWLFPLLVWDTPRSSTCGKGPTHLENSKMRRLVKKLNIIMLFFVSFLVFSYLFLVFFGFSSLRLTLIILRDCFNIISLSYTISQVSQPRKRLISRSRPRSRPGHTSDNKDQLS